MGLSELRVVLAAGGLAAALLVSACRADRGANEKAPQQPSTPSTAEAPPRPKSASEERVPAYTYPPPVKGHFKETNTGDFDLVDGVAVTTGAAPDATVVFAVAKPIASPVLASSPCPLTQARSLTALRNAGWVEVALDSGGRSKYFAAGTPFGGSSRETDVGSHPWKSDLRLSGATAIGSVEHKHDGRFQFELPRWSSAHAEPSEADFSEKRRGDPSAARPELDAVMAVYNSLHAAAAKRDLKAFLAAQGFADTQTGAVRGLAVIDADFAAFADRFLSPGEGGEGSRGAGWASVRAEGVNSRGAKFANYYWFTGCGDKLVLTRISVNPQ